MSTYTKNLDAPFDEYSISLDGKLYSVKRSAVPRARKLTQIGQYLTAVISSRDGKHKKVQIHRLVAQAHVFNPDPNTFKYVQHIDGNCLNNHMNNLQWTAVRPNANYHSSKEGRSIQCIETSRCFESKYSAAKDLQVSWTAINQALSAGTAVKGYHFRYTSKK